ncbi:hypothetical protein KDE12_03980 [Campylobacter sp. faydin G-105]|uniref:hypothetical protein n=1 Tax=Campylobacter anatolicus TaxID=2829105 RepID=UPI001B934BEC|nr:hypothetical protein [Campylobacter anatolicus]MBR8462012.1 hypothetical protein [Campylobacter anatolicus]
MPNEVLLLFNCLSLSSQPHIVNLCGSLYVKKFLLDPIRKIVKLTSLNDFYQDIVVKGDELEQLNIVGKVRARFSMDINSFK